MAEEWDRFTFEVGKGNSREVTTVRHIAHVPAARRIVEDGRIKAGLVYDESRLSTSRISVALVSPNTWELGSIYGTVEFRFAWADLVAGQKIYWVEAMINYDPPAYRLLLSKRDIPPGMIKPYDPTNHEGPLRLRDGTYYRNDACTSELMVDDDLSLQRCIGLGFVTHNIKCCRPFGNACAERRQQPSVRETSGKILSFVVGKGLHDLDKHFKLPQPKQKFTDLDIAYSGLELALPTGVNFGGTISLDRDCKAVVRNSLALYGGDELDQTRELLSLISSKDKFTKALKAVMRTHFDDPGWEPNNLF